jgi:hypothetical protein
MIKMLLGDKFECIDRGLAAHILGLIEQHTHIVEEKLSSTKVYYPGGPRWLQDRYLQELESLKELKTLIEAAPRCD